MNSQFQYQTSEFNYPPPKPSRRLVELFTEFVNNNLFKLGKSTNRDEVKKGLILQYFLGAFPELTDLNDGKKDGLIAMYNQMIELNSFIDFGVKHNLSRYGTSGGSKKRKQVYKKKSNKSRKTKKIN